MLSNQRAAYDAMRERCPVAHSDFLGWSLFRHQDIVDVLDDPETFSSASRHRAIPNGIDPPEHTVYRRLLEPYFSSESIMRFEPALRKIATEMTQALLDGNSDTVDLISEFAEPFPLRALCVFLGWRDDNWERLRGWNHGNQQVALSSDRAAGKILAAEFTSYVEQELQAHRAAGQDQLHDITTDLMTREVNGARLSDEDIVSILRNWTAGQGTVASGIGNVIHYLAQDGQLQAQLRANPGLLPAAIDEILRVDGPLVMNRRTATRDVQIGGRQIGTGERLTLIWIAANRDERAFDDPESVRLDRDARNNLVFGMGIHDCVGAPLARLELRLAVEELLGRTSQIELAEDDPPRAVYPSNGFRSLMVRLR
ncbi:MAG TPA: cytochrome P450 [Thermomicrobiales bacterium]|nr:cytochrome P450 [Thermomicrobiales bacterium]